MGDFTERPYTRNSVLSQTIRVLAAASENIDAYTVPAGYEFFLRVISGRDSGTPGSNMHFYINRSGTQHQLKSTPGTATTITYEYQPMIFCAAGDIIGMRLAGSTVGNTATINVWGELIPVGGWV